MNFNEIDTNIPYEEIDIEIRELIFALNTLDGIKTTSCCCGHGKNPCMIWLAVRDVRSLNSLCFNYLNPFYGWQVVIETNISRNQDFIQCCLQSANINIDCVTSEANELVKKINNRRKVINKDKPEPGDVWEWCGTKIFITCALGDEKIGAISFMDNRNFHHCTDGFDVFSQKIRAGVMKYLGKSKVSIIQLFEVQDD